MLIHLGNFKYIRIFFHVCPPQSWKSLLVLSPLSSLHGELLCWVITHSSPPQMLEPFLSDHPSLGDEICWLGLSCQWCSLQSPRFIVIFHCCLDWDQNSQSINTSRLIFPSLWNKKKSELRVKLGFLAYVFINQSTSHIILNACLWYSILIPMSVLPAWKEGCAEARCWICCEHFYHELQSWKHWSPFQKWPE